MKLELLLKRTDELLSLGQKVMETAHVGSYGSVRYVDTGLFHQFRTQSLSFLKSTFGPEHPYFKDFEGLVRDVRTSYTEKGIGILNAVKDEISGGWLFTIKGVVSAEIFSDFLEMASYLLSEGYKDPAAVMIGGVLEGHLRQLSLKNGIAAVVVKDGKGVSKKADALNSELAAANVYGKLDQKSVTAWLDLRNKAAHGEYGEYTKEQVELMCSAVTEFKTRISL